MKAEVIRLNECTQEAQDAAIGRGAALLAEGGLVVFPTETVYGLGGNALREDAATKIYRVKDRPSDNPLIVHIADPEQLDTVADCISEAAHRLTERFWPGPLTLILHAKDTVPKTTTGGLSTVAVRLPSHPVARELIRRAGVPIAAPSANISGRPSITSDDYLDRELEERVDMILLDEDSEFGIESTIVDMTGEPPVILRPGVIGRAELERCIGHVDVDTALLGAKTAPKAPGMKYTHYSPEAQVILVEREGDWKDRLLHALSLHNEAGETARVLAPSAYSGDWGCYAVDMGADSLAYGSKLFKTFRMLDRQSVDFIYCISCDQDDVGMAVRNRILKAAGYRTL